MSQEIMQQENVNQETLQQETVIQEDIQQVKKMAKVKDIISNLVFFACIFAFIAFIAYLVYEPVHRENALRKKVESITPVVAEVRSIEKVYQRYSDMYVLAVSSEDDVVSIIRTHNLETTDGETITEGMKIRVFLWQFKDGTKMLRREHGKETVLELLFGIGKGGD